MKLCGCGCGVPTAIAERTDTRKGWVKGQPYRFLAGHQRSLRYQLESVSHPGLCACGCGRLTTLALRSDRSLGHVIGQPKRFCHGHNARKMPDGAGYMQKSTSLYKQGREYCYHRIRAEKALGKPLPKGAEVHHAGAGTRDDGPLVICQDRAYHQLLHKRAEMLARSRFQA